MAEILSCYFPRDMHSYSHVSHSLHTPAQLHQSVDMSSLGNMLTGAPVLIRSSQMRKNSAACQRILHQCTVNRVICRRKRLIVVTASSTSLGEPMQDGLVNAADFQVASRALVTVLCAVANKILYKMALVPLKDYPFFLALVNTFGYVVVYFSILYVRYQRGIVTNEMLGLSKFPFVLVGVLEALGVAAGMAAASVLPGPSISVLLQTFLVWQLLLSTMFLKRRYVHGQIVGCALVLVGVVIALTGTGGDLVALSSPVGHLPSFVMILSCALQASSTIVKELIFRNGSKNLKGGSVDLFVVNSFGSAYQALFVLLMLPFLSQIRGIPFGQLRVHMLEGAGCLFNIGNMNTECTGATMLTFAYVIVNLAFNISLLSLLKKSSAVVSSLCMTLAVPISIYIFTLPLPYIGKPASLNAQFVIGTVVLLCGLACYNFSCNYKSSKA